jgi:hypothetical protein
MEGWITKEGLTNARGLRLVVKEKEKGSLQE